MRSFGTVTIELDAMVAWFTELGIQTVALEATGVYWLALVDKLTEAGIAWIVVNPREIKQIAGRKSDVQDCQWIQTLHSYGLLRPCFLPETPISQLRALTRHRGDQFRRHPPDAKNPPANERSTPPRGE